MCYDESSGTCCEQYMFDEIFKKIIILLQIQYSNSTK